MTNVYTIHFCGRNDSRLCPDYIREKSEPSDISAKAWNTDTSPRKPELLSTRVLETRDSDTQGEK
jgi:hypothetical protein